MTFPKFLCLLMALSASRMQAAGLTLQEAFTAALKQSETLASQQETVIQAEERFRETLGSLWPWVSGSGQWFQQDDHGLPPSQQAWQTTYKATATKPLFRGFREYAVLAVAGDLIVSQKEAYEWAGEQLYRDTAQAFYLVLGLERDIAIQQEEMGFYDRRISDLARRAKIGRSRKTEVLTARAARAVLKAQVEASLAQLGSARELIAFLTGLPGDSALADMEPSPGPLEPLEYYLETIPSRPDVKAAEANLRAARAGIKVAWGAHLPSADLSGNYYFQRPGQLQDVKWDAQLSVTLPIFLGGTVASQTRQAESQARRAELALQQVKRLAQEDLRTAHSLVRFDRAQILSQQEAFELSKLNYEAQARDYNLGLVNNVEVLQALTSYHESQRAATKARFIAKADFARLEALAARIIIPSPGKTK